MGIYDKFVYPHYINMKVPAIYKIESKLKPERVYIGSSIDVSDRWRCHLKDLRNDKHHASKLQNHFNKYGEEDLIFIIIEPCLPSFLTIREQYYIDTIKPFFNSSPVAGSCLGVKRSEETKQNISKSKKGHKMSPEFCKQRSEMMKGNSLNKGKHWKWTDEQKEKWLIGEKNPSHRKYKQNKTA